VLFAHDHERGFAFEAGLPDSLLPHGPVASPAEDDERLWSRGTLRGSEGVFSYLVPANSLTVVRVAR
jgi:hypothetical protein